VTRFDVFLWVALPYLCLAVFALGHVWRYRRDQYTWSARSTQLLERRLLMWGSLLFHLGLLAVIGGHVLGILVPASWTATVGIGEDAYHWIALVAGLTAGVATTAGFAILLYRRGRVPRVRATTSRSDLFLTYPLLAIVIATGMAATISNAVDEHTYRETVSPWFRGIFSFRPRGELMTEAPFVFQAHAVSAFLLFAAWPFTRLVHAWSVPVRYLRRAPILYRSRAPRPALSGQRVEGGAS
jgi:nitrate reductase gamma subunit